MCMEDAELGITVDDIVFCFGYCQMTVWWEEKQWQQYHKLEVVEFLEFIGRLAHKRFEGRGELAFQPLVEKIELVLDDLMKGFGLQRVDVNIEVEEVQQQEQLQSSSQPQAVKPQTA